MILTGLSAEDVAAVREAGIPVSTMWPTTSWVASLDEASVAPTQFELDQLRSYIECTVRHWADERTAERVLGAEFAILPGHNTAIFRKRGEDDWAYRRFSWTQGPGYVPVPDVPLESGLIAPLGLGDVLDEFDRIGDHQTPQWEAWKSAHPLLFS